MDNIEFKNIIRAPKYPVIVLSAERLYSAFNIDELAQSCVHSKLIEGKKIVQVIDSRGEEFWYTPEQYLLSPGFEFKKWTKKSLIETFNSSLNAKVLKQEYSIKSLSARRLEQIVGDLAELLR